MVDYQLYFFGIDGRSVSYNEAEVERVNLDPLHGREQFEQDNESLFLKVQEFVIKSERLSPTIS